MRQKNALATIRTIPLTYSDEHSQHHPPVEYSHNRLMPFAETPDRALRIFDHLCQAGLAEPVKITQPASVNSICAIHDARMVQWLQKISLELTNHLDDDTDSSQVEPHEDQYLYPSVFGIRPSMQRLADDRPFGHYAFDVFAPIGQGTWTAILYSASVAIAGAALLGNPSPVIYALCRPPGHHAGRDFIGGYCYLNNAAIAANQLLSKGKVAIIDLDYHHGNGTQEIFWDNPNVFVGSIHANPHQEYPYFSGYTNETGGDNAPFTNLNLPLPLGTNGKTYLTALYRLLETMKEFDPVTMVVSIGFDTSADDPTCTFQLTKQDYLQIGEALSQLSLPTLFVQEGGYNVMVNGVLAEWLFRGFLKHTGVS